MRVNIFRPRIAWNVLNYGCDVALSIVYHSLTQVGLGDQQPESWMLDQNLTVDELFPMLTLDGTYASGQESIIGSLWPDKQADLVILSANPLDVKTEELMEIDILLTMVGGNVAHCAAGAESFCPSAAPTVAPNATATGLPADTKGLAQAASLSASASLTDSPPANAVDGDPESVWNSGDSSRQWFRFEFGTQRVITGVRLLTAQDPPGYTVHRIWGGDSEDTVELLYEFAGNTSDGDVLEVQLTLPAENIIILYVVTVDSPSWVAWREVEIFGE